MDRKILAAVDGSHHSMNALRYLGATFGGVKDFYIDMLHMLSAPPPVLVSEAKVQGDALAKLKMFRGKMKGQAEKVLDKCEQELIRTGFPQDNIGRRILEARGGTAKSIVFEAQNSLYDALVVGRRGMGRFQEMFVGSVSQKCVAEAQSIPVWVVDGQAKGSKVLLALDGSEDSFRAVDHVAFLLAGNPETEVILCHVSSSLARACPLEMDEELRKLEEELMALEEEVCLESFFLKAKSMLVEAGIPPEKISIHFQTKGLEIARAILRDARQNGCGSLVIGRRGKSRPKDFLMGSITSRVVLGADDLAVWVVV